MKHVGRWNALVSLATLGTARAALSHEQHWPDAALATRDAPPGTALLRAAAASELWLLAGARSPAKEPKARPAAPAPASRVTSETAAWRLGRMLAGERRELVAEWFEHAARAGAVLPPHWAPAALECLDAVERQAYARVLGAHAVWLAAQNPEWSISIVSEAAPAEGVWTSGTLEARRAALSAMRRIDAARARAWLERTWEEDPADARVEFLKAFLVGLTAADEPFLERALDDKRKGVRLAAADCLARLRDSAHAQRGVERLRPLLEWHAKKGGLLGMLTSPKLEVELPAALDAAAIRDGIEQKPPAQRKIGERAYWLVQMIACVRPSYWTETWGVDAAKVLDAALKTDHAHELLAGFTEAALRHPSEDWLEALCDRSIPRREKDDEALALTQNLVRLLEAAPPSARDRLLLSVLRKLEPARFDVAVAALGSAKARWSSDVTKAACSLLAEIVRNDSRPFPHPRTTLAEWGVRADVGTGMQTVPTLLDKLADGSPWRNAIEHLTDTLRFRADMQQELSQ